MKNFKQFLLESSKNTHLEHLEDYVFISGVSGINSSIIFLKTLLEMFKGNSDKSINLSVKWDGAPAIVCGINPENKKFFVGTKSVFNKEPKINYTKSDILKNHGAGELATKLTIALEHLSKLGIRGVIQGDLLFTTGDVKKISHGDENLIAFKPNTITYAVPQNSDLANKILTSKIGIVFHTSYSGKSIKELSASIGVNISGLKKNSNVWATDADFRDNTGTATMTKRELKYVNDRIELLNSLVSKLNSSSISNIISNAELVSMIKMYINSKIRDGQNISSTKKYANGLIDFIKNKLKGEVDKLKTDAAKSRKLDKLKDILSFIDIHKSDILNMFLISATIIDVKMVFLKKLNTVNSIGTFLETPDGFKVTAPEGFVAVDHLGNAFKLVDRLEFSRANFNISKF
jgi:hypothetical protein